MVAKKPPEHVLTVEDVDRLLRIAARQDTSSWSPEYQATITIAKTIQPGDIVLLPTRGKVSRRGPT